MNFFQSMAKEFKKGFNQAVTEKDKLHIRTEINKTKQNLKDIVNGTDQEKKGDE